MGWMEREERTPAPGGGKGDLGGVPYLALVCLGVTHLLFLDQGLQSGGSS